MAKVPKWPKSQNGQNALVLTALPVSSAGKCGGGGRGVVGGGVGGQRKMTKQEYDFRIIGY